MIIIVEGIDRVGKTTLINKLAESCDIRPFVDSYLKFNYLNYVTDTLMTVEGNRDDIIANTEKINSLLNFLEQFGDRIGNVVFDRLHMSEFVYGANDRNYFSFEAFNNFDVRLSKLGALIVYVEPKDLEWSSKQHGSNLSYHRSSFEHIIDKSECEVLRCNIDTLDEAVAKIKEKVENNGSN